MSDLIPDTYYSLVRDVGFSCLQLLVIYMFVLAAREGSTVLSRPICPFSLSSQFIRNLLPRSYRVYALILSPASTHTLPSARAFASLWARLIQILFPPVVSRSYALSPTILHAIVKTMGVPNRASSTDSAFLYFHCRTSRNLRSTLAPPCSHTPPPPPHIPA